MKTVRRLLYRDIVSSVAFVALAFVALFFFFDFVDDLDGVGKRGRTVAHVVLGALYEVPGHLYADRRDLRRGLVTMCAAGRGMAPAIIVERL